MIDIGDLVKTRRDCAAIPILGIVLDLGFHSVTVRWSCGTVQDVDWRSLEVVSESR
jgi:hypothetical protein